MLKKRRLASSPSRRFKGNPRSRRTRIDRTWTYDLTADPHELHDLAPAGGYEDLLAELQRRDLSTNFEKSRRSEPEMEEAMRSLGCVN